MIYTVNVTSKAPTVELMGPKNGNAMARNQTGKITGIRQTARSNMFFEVWMPISFSHTKYRGVTANPTVMNCHKNASPY
jgi:hypothetical protein